MTTTLLLLLLTTLAAPPAGQEAAREGAPGMTGRWALDKSKSDFGPFRESPAAGAEVTLEISQSGPEFRVRRRSVFAGGREQTQEFAYYSDGRGEANPTSLGKVGVESRTGWEGGKLVSRSSLRRRGPGGRELKFDTVERWQLTQGGRALVQTVVVESPSGTQQVRQVYSRLP